MDIHNNSAKQEPILTYYNDRFMLPTTFIKYTGWFRQLMYYVLYFASMAAKSLTSGLPP